MRSVSSIASLNQAIAWPATSALGGGVVGVFRAPRDVVRDQPVRRSERQRPGTPHAARRRRPRGFRRRHSRHSTAARRRSGRRCSPAAPPSERLMTRQIVALLAASVVFWPMRCAGQRVVLRVAVVSASGRIATVGGPNGPLRTEPTTYTVAVDLARREIPTCRGPDCNDSTASAAAAGRVGFAARVRLGARWWSLATSTE